MRISMLLTTYVRRTLRTSTIALLLPLGMAVPVTMIASPALAVSYTHLRAPRDLSTSRMPSSA